MYEAFFGLNERPFDLTTNPRFLFLTAGHREALSNLHYGITSHKGVTLLLGEAGTGKTTLIRSTIEQQAGPNRRIVYLSNPTLTRAEFLEFLADGFQLSADAATSKVRLLNELTALLTGLRADSGLAALVIDEAQSLPLELLEEIRLLSNLETAFEKLLPVVLAGQPELADRLNEPQLRQLKQRIGLRCRLRPLEIKETAAYIAKRIKIAGGEAGSIFTIDAVRAIHRQSSGIPRTISVICDNALVSGFALQQRPIEANIVEEVGRDFDIVPDADPGLPREWQVEAASRPHAVPRNNVEVFPPRAPTHRASEPAVYRPSTMPSPAPPVTSSDGDGTGDDHAREMFTTVTRKRRFSFF
ncbi:MAG: AAA family ATPase [Vicinamibacteraceae bacterium]|nr:AAA family ATPase [Vicinamibacteraceae bacterium]